MSGPISSVQCRCLSAASSSCRVVSDSAASQDSAANTNTLRHFTVRVMSDKPNQGMNQQTLITRAEERRFRNVLRVGCVGSGNKSLKSCPPSRECGKYLSTDLMIRVQDLTIKTSYLPSSLPPIGQVIFANFNFALNAKICIAGLIDTSNVSNIRLVLQSIGISPAFGIWGW